MGDLDRLRSIENLQRAWRWVRSSADATYKSYFRHLYRNFAVADEALLADLSDRLRRGVYHPREACKLFFPKASGVLRPYTLLAVEDQIAYQGAVNLIAEKLFPRVKHRYNKQVFGHLYAGKSSTWFYRKWSDGYKAFNDAARIAYSDGFEFTASFDLTACYDSLDHRVLRHFLGRLGLDPDFSQQLTNWLEAWTATNRGIFHNHGIPQGPLPSGLLSEVVLSHFDSLKVRGIDFRYFRYVDDIRLFARSEKELRRLLVELDLLSKDIGLFPQSGKISIHRVRDIEEELKSVSNPAETVIKRNLVDQKRLQRRINELTPRYEIIDQTRFKYLLAHAEPSAALTTRLWRILEKHPELYKSICGYLRRYRKLPRVAADKLVETIRSNALYHSVQAEFVSVADGRLPESQDRVLAGHLRRLWAPGSLQPDLLARVGIYLMRTGHLTPRQVSYVSASARSWWTRATIIDALARDHIAKSAIDNILQKGISDESRDVAATVAWKAFATKSVPAGPRRGWNPSASIMLKELGIIARRPSGYCGVTKSIERLEPRIASLKWKKLLGTHYSQAERQMVEVVALSSTNITAFVNALDVFNDILLDSLFTSDGGIGTYNLGRIGSAVGSTTSRFATKYPATFAYVKEVHDNRYVSMHSHPRVKATGKPTKKISYRFLGKARRLLRAAISELGANGH